MRAEASKIVAGISAGGTFEMPMNESPWDTYFAMFRDKYGIEWRWSNRLLTKS